VPALFLSVISTLEIYNDDDGGDNKLTGYMSTACMFMWMQL